jgi:hypothetical protein
VKHSKWKQLLHWGGLLIGIIGVAFVVRKLFEYSDQISFSAFLLSSIFLLAKLGIICYCSGLTNILLTN